MLLAMACLLAGCRPTRGEPARPSSGTLAVAWTGTAAGRFSATAEARWCPRDTLVEITAVRNDTAFGVTLAPVDTVRPGTYVVLPAVRFVPARPQASVALRWLGEAVIMPFEAITGAVTVTEGGTRRISGTIDVHLRRPGATDSVRVTGGFSRLALAPAAGPCGRATRR
jgi:hypothetical protein